MRSTIPLQVFSTPVLSVAAGSRVATVDGAKSGFVMKTHPAGIAPCHEKDSHLGEAEDPVEVQAVGTGRVPGEPVDGSERTESTDVSAEQTTALPMEQDSRHDARATRILISVRPGIPWARQTGPSMWTTVMREHAVRLRMPLRSFRPRWTTDGACTQAMAVGRTAMAFHSVGADVLIRVSSRSRGFAQALLLRALIRAFDPEDFAIVFEHRR